MSKEKRNKDNDVSLGHRHYWTDTQGHAHRVVFDDKTLEKPRATWVVLVTVTIVALVAGVVIITTLHKPTGARPFVQERAEAATFALAQTVAAGVESGATTIAAGWNDEFFLGDAAGVSLFDAAGQKLENWSFDEPEAPTALAFVSDEENVANGLLLVAFKDKVKYLQFSLDQVVPATGRGDAALPGGADEETESNNAVVRTAARGALGAPKTLLVKTGADIRGLDSSGERLFVADYAAARVWRYSLKKLYALESGADEPTPDCELGAPDEARGYPGLKPTFPRNFCATYDRKRNVLFVANPGLFRIDAFDPETGAWSSVNSWSRTPGATDAFRGASNPIAVVAGDNRFLVAESGVFTYEQTNARYSPLRFFSESGEWLADVGGDFLSSSSSEWLSVAALAASRDFKRFYVLNVDGSVDVWERR